MRLGDDRDLGRDEPDEVLVRRFLSEMRAAASWHHRHLLRVHRLRHGHAASRYQLGVRLGTGGMAEVFAATMVGAEGFARRVAIKRVLPGLSEVPTFAAMFVSEARIASQLSHPNIVSVLDLSRDLDGRLFLVMEYVDGKDLASLLESGPIAPSLAIFIATELLRGLGYAHDLADPATGTRGMVHRDVSPQNLLLSFEGAVKVSDFGLAKARAASQSVRSETVRGKPSYMAPEQIACEPLDGRADLYAVGVMLWEMLAHRPLFAGTTREIMGQVMFRDIPTPSSVRSGVPADLETVAMTLLARDCEGRYPTAEAAIAALLACADAPRDGRGELVQVLAERFPEVAGARAPRATALAAGPVAGSAPGAQVASPITVNAPPSQVVVEPRPPLYVDRDHGLDRGLDRGLGRAFGRGLARRSDRWQRRRFVAATIAGCVGFVLGFVAASAVLALVIR